MKITPLKAIKKHCLECSGYEKKQVRECVIKDCVLYEYRQGKNPNRKGSTLSKNTASITGFEKADGYVSELPPIGRHRKKVLNYFSGGVYGSQKAKEVR